MANVAKGPFETMNALMGSFRTRPPSRRSRGDAIFELILMPLMSPDLILYGILIALALVVLLPLAGVELLAQLVVGGVLAAARALGWARSGPSGRPPNGPTGPIPTTASRSGCTGVSGSPPRSGCNPGRSDSLLTSDPTPDCAA